MAKSPAKNQNGNGANLGFEAQLWATADKLHGNADWSPYEGLEISGRLNYTILRGEILVEQGEFLGDKVFGNLLLADV